MERTYSLSSSPLSFSPVLDLGSEATTGVMFIESPSLPDYRYRTGTH